MVHAFPCDSNVEMTGITGYDVTKAFFKEFGNVARPSADVMRAGPIVAVAAIVGPDQAVEIRHGVIRSVSNGLLPTHVTMSVYCIADRLSSVKT